MSSANMMAAKVPSTSSRSSSWITFLLCLLLPLFLNLFAHPDYFFTRPLQETGDYAANALQITNAKTFHEIHGNYSRWEFNHPGPAFFYIYAWGEILFHDLLHISPAPHNAHALMGLLLECLLFAAGAVICRRFFPQPLFLPLYLVAGMAHLGRAGYDFIGLWPPQQVLMSFVLMLISGAALMARYNRVLPVFILSCCLCIHSHVAQPLFVLPIATLALGSALLGVVREKNLPLTVRNLTLALREVFGNQYGALSALIVIVFLVPIVVDLSLGKNGNFAHIVHHMQTHKGDRHSLRDAFVYFLSFLSYWGIMDIPAPIRFSEAILAHYKAFLSWFLLIAIPLVFFARRIFSPVVSSSSEPEPPQTARFIKAVYAIFFLCCALTLYWGVIMNGPMYAFNAFLNYGILLLPILLVCGMVAQLLPLHFHRYAIFALLPVIGVLFLSASHRPIQSDSGHPPIDAKAFIAAADTAGVLQDKNAIVFLDFVVEDWSKAATLALQLQRSGVNWRVEPGWGFLFGRSKVLSAIPIDQPLVCFRVESDPKKPNNPAQFGPEDIVLQEQPTQIDPSHFPQSLLPSSPVLILAEGLDGHSAEKDFVWSKGPRTVINLPLKATTHPVRIVLDLHPLTQPGKLDEQRFTASFGMYALGSFTLSKRNKITLEIPKDVWNREISRSPQVPLTFNWQDATTPAQIGMGTDGRVLAVAFHSIVFQ